MSNTVKCSVCNIVIDEMLSYIQNKLSSISEDTLVRLCTSAFTATEIQKSKSLLFDAVITAKQNIQRQGDGKEQRDIYDIIGVFRTEDPCSIPVFVARQLEKLPPITFDHLDCTKLLRDIVRLQNDIAAIKADYVTSDELEDLRKEVQASKNVTPSRLSTCNVNARRGAWCYDSGPLGLSHQHNSTLNDTTNINKDQTLSSVSSSQNVTYRSIIMSGSRPTADNIVLRPAPVKTTEMSHHAEQMIALAEPAPNKGNSIPVPVPQNIETMQNDKDDWQTVQYKKKKSNKRFEGQFGTAITTQGNFKAAERRVPMFITKVDKNSIVSEIADYIRSETNESVTLEKLKIRNEEYYSAYKFFVAESKVSLFLDNNLWPKGIIFRKFVHYKPKEPRRNNFADGSTPII